MSTSKRFENVFVKNTKKARINKNANDNDDRDPLDGVVPLTLYQKLDCIVFAEPGLLPTTQQNSSNDECFKWKTAKDVTLVELRRDILNPKEVVVISDDDDIYSTEDRTHENDNNKDDQESTTLYNCDEEGCNGKYFQTALRLKEHIRRVHSSDKRIHQCWDCEKSFPVEYLLRRHRTVHDRKKHQCPICLKMLSLSSSLTSHMRSHSGEKPFTCIECGKSFTRHSGLKSHVRFVHLTDTSLQCLHCDIRFERRVLLAKHLRDVHVGERTLECNLCGRCFRNTAAMGAHMTKRHQFNSGPLIELTLERPNSKDTSNRLPKPAGDLISEPLSDGLLPSNQPEDLSKKTGSQVSKVKTEIRCTEEVSSKIRSPEKCMQCGAVLSSRWLLIKHLRSHFPDANGKKMDFWCQICNKNFDGTEETVGHFDRYHSAVVSSERRFKCDLCQRKFKRSEHLKRHRQTHSGERPHQCHACYKGFTRRLKLAEHLKKVHSYYLPTTNKINSRPHKLVLEEMEQGLADGSKSVIVKEGKVVGFKTVRRKEKSD